MFIFGGLFGDRSNVQFNIALINNSDSQFSKEFVRQANQDQKFKISADIASLEAAKDKMNRGELDAAIVLPEDFGDINPEEKIPNGTMQVFYTQNNAEAGRTLTSIMQSLITGINKKYVEVHQPFKVVGQQTNDQGLSSFDYVFSGLLGFSILGIGVFGPMNVFPELKKQGILRRLHTTTLRVWQYFLSTAASQVFIGLLSFAIQFAVAITIFDLRVVGNYAELILFLILSTIMILGVGLAIGGWAKNQRQAAPLGNIITFPMMFLSGAFFPRFIMPEWLQQISAYIPLTPVIDGVRLIATEGKHLTEIGSQLGLVLGWLVIIYLIAFKVFKWE